MARTCWHAAHASAISAIGSSGSRSTEAWNDGSWESRPTDPWTAGGPQWAFPVDSAYYDEDDGTDTDTSSDDGREDIARPDVSNMSDAEAAMTIYMAYRNAKTNWRRLTGKPVRKFAATSGDTW